MRPTEIAVPVKGSHADECAQEPEGDVQQTGSQRPRNNAHDGAEQRAQYAGHIGPGRIAVLFKLVVISDADEPRGFRRGRADKGEQRIGRESPDARQAYPHAEIVMLHGSAGKCPVCRRYAGLQFQKMIGGDIDRHLQRLLLRTQQERNAGFHPAYCAGLRIGAVSLRLAGGRPAVR